LQYWCPIVFTPKWYTHPAYSATLPLPPTEEAPPSDDDLSGEFISDLSTVTVAIELLLLCSLSLSLYGSSI
jgi:hypothetical protein